MTARSRRARSDLEQPDRSPVEYLLTEQLIDCSGTTTHVLRLEVDGTVSITFAGHGTTVRIDPIRRVVLTPGMTVPDQIMEHAAAMRVL